MANYIEVGRPAVLSKLIDENGNLKYNEKK